MGGGAGGRGGGGGGGGGGLVRCIEDDDDDDDDDEDDDDDDDDDSLSRPRSLHKCPRSDFFFRGSRFLMEYFQRSLCNPALTITTPKGPPIKYVTLGGKMGGGGGGAGGGGGGGAGRGGGGGGASVAKHYMAL